MITRTHTRKKQGLFLLVFSLFTSIGFTQTTKSHLNLLIRKYNLDSAMIFTWRNDSLGCEGKRSYVFKVDTMQVLKGIYKEDFLELFGTPDLISKDDPYQYNVFSSCENRKVHDVSYVEIVFQFIDNRLNHITSIIVD